MFNPLDMLQGPNGAGMQTVAQQFGLTPDQTRRAMEALLPAFALGMQRAPSADPTGLSQFFAMPGATRGASPAETMLGQMFGSPAMTQAILQQASAASGVGSQVLRQMLPMMAGAVVASIVHMLLNQQAPEAARPPAPAPSPFPPVWTEMMKAFLPPEPAKAPPPRPQPAPKAAAPAGGAAETGHGMFQQMLRTGAEVQEQNVKAMQGLFDALWPQDASGTAKAPDALEAAREAAKGRKGRMSPR